MALDYRLSQYGDMKKKMVNHVIDHLALLSDSNRIQTYNLLIRSQMLYSVELWSRVVSQLRCKGIAFFLYCKTFVIFLQFFFIFLLFGVKMGFIAR